jgi:hypothetical protein
MQVAMPLLGKGRNPIKEGEVIAEMQGEGA